MRIYIYIILLFFLPLKVVWAQQNQYEANVGIHVGIMNYYGDLNSKFIAPNDRLRDFEGDFLSYGISVERNFSPAWSGKIQYNRGQFIANDRAINWDGSRDFGNSNDARSLNAMTDIDDLSFMFTYHSDNGKLLSKNAFISPYLSFGAGITLFEVFADLKHVNGNRYYYWQDNTIRSMPQGSPDADIIEQDGSFETNVTSLDTEKDYNTTVLNIPVGAGLKFRLAERIGLALDYTLRYTFTDYLDDVSGDYRDEYTSAAQAYAANPTNTVAERRGNDNGNDWYAFLSVSMHYSFGKKHRSFDSPVIYSSSIYEPAHLPPTLPKVDTVSSLPLRRLSVLRDSVSLEPKPVNIPKSSVTVSEERSIVRNVRRANDFQERRQVHLERRDTLDSLSYLINKQRLENELFDLRINASNPEVRLVAKEDSIRSAQEFYSARLTRNDSVVIDDTISDKREVLNKQIEALDRQLQQVLNDTTGYTVLDGADSIAEDTTNISFNVQEQEYNRRIDSLQSEIENLRQQANEDSLRMQTDTVEDTSYEAGILEKRMDAIQAEMEAMKADTNKTDTAERTSDSLVFIQLQQRYDTLEERMKALSENQQDGNVNDTVTGNIPDDAYRTNATRERISSLEREIDNLRRERDNARNNSGDVVVESGQNERNARIASLEREIDRLNNRNDAIVPVVVPGGSDNGGNNISEEEVESNQQMIDSLQQQIAELRAQRDAGRNTAQVTAPSSTDATNPEVEKLRQEIVALRANIIAMDEDRNMTEQKTIIPELPKTEVFFDVGSATLSDTDRARIAELVSFVKKYPEAGLLLKGYTDPTGSPEKNLVLSKRRAESVRQVLVKEGIAEKRIDTEFFGADNKTSKDLSYGRRVEIIVESSN